MKTRKVILVLCVAGGVACASLAAEKSSPPAPAPAAGQTDQNEATRLIQQANEQMAEKKWAEAVVQLEQALRLDPSNEVARFALGSAYIKTDRFKEGGRILESLLKDYPQNPAIRNNLAWIYAKSTDPELRNPEKAIRFAQDALFLAPSDFNVWGTLAEAYYAAGNYEHALRVATGALRLNESAGAPDIKEVRELYDRCLKAAGATAAPDAKKDE